MAPPDAGRRHRRRLGRRRSRARPDHRPGQERRQRRPHLAIRIDTDKIPGPLLRAYTQIEIEARAQLNPSGFATKAQREEAKEAAKAAPRPRPPTAGSAATITTRSSGTARPRPFTPARTSASVLERLQALFRETFDRTLEPITAGSLARRLAPGDPSADRGLSAIFEHGPFAAGRSSRPRAAASVAWAGRRPDQPRLPGQRVPGLDLARRSRTTARPSSSPTAPRPRSCWPRRLTLDCPRGETGRDQLTDDAPTRLPEAFRALQAGKLPRKAGMILVRHGAQYELTLQAETLAVSGAALPKPEDAASRAHEQRIARIDSLRHLTESLDLLFQAYLAPPDRHRLDRRARPHPPMAPGGLTAPRGIDRLPQDPLAALPTSRTP